MISIIAALFILRPPVTVLEARGILRAMPPFDDIFYTDSSRSHKQGLTPAIQSLNRLRLISTKSLGSLVRQVVKEGSLNERYCINMFLSMAFKCPFEEIAPFALGSDGRIYLFPKPGDEEKYLYRGATGLRPLERFRYYRFHYSRRFEPVFKAKNFASLRYPSASPAEYW